MTTSTKGPAPYRHTPPIPRWWQELKDEAERGLEDAEAAKPPAFYVLVPSLLEPGTHIAVSSDWSMAPATPEQLERAGLR